ncbi:hypothetical protein H0H81_010867 [Sphagnurus paluster]|uniref:Uncharacterized protein n=1 Tax=Sphagnurus paluster TaxID=117069 RepID=A0A9P7GHR8_9AGAR|nr:hypothetical protein H0H81_010867 [Sphagnurus paluster]
MPTPGEVDTSWPGGLYYSQAEQPLGQYVQQDHRYTEPQWNYSSQPIADYSPSASYSSIPISHGPSVHSPTFGYLTQAQEPIGSTRSTSRLLSPSGSFMSASPRSPRSPSYEISQAEDSGCLDSHREQLRLFKEVLQLPMGSYLGPFIPQKMYIPHTTNDRRRYVEEIVLQQPIYFEMQDPDEYGIPLTDALHSRVRRLRSHEEYVFEGRGPSISVRIQWPGYQYWSRQIPTKDFRCPPQPITKAKLAKNIAKCVQRFLDARENKPLDDDVPACWKVGKRPNEIKFEDLILVSMHHVSMGSWQPQLRLRRPLF